MIQALVAFVMLAFAIYVFGVILDFVYAHWIFFVTAFWLAVTYVFTRIGFWVYRLYERYSSTSRTASDQQGTGTSSPALVRSAFSFVRKPAKISSVPIEVRPLSFRDFLKPVPDQLKNPIKGRSSTAGEFYSVDLSEQTCTCANWQADRCRYLVGDIRRLCKHMVRLYGKHDLFKDEARWLAQFGLLPFRTGPYCAAQITSEGKIFRAIRYKDKRYAQVVAPTGWKNRPEDCFSMFVEDFRWCREWPPSSTWLKPAFVTWLRSPASSKFSRDPERPPEAIEAGKYFDQRSRKEADEAGARKTCCFNCGSQMRSLAPTIKHNVRCPTCGAVNYVAGNGSLHNPERIALYAHYDGNYDDRTQIGVVPTVLARRETELQKVDLDRKSGRLTADQSRAEKFRIRGNYKRELEALSAEKAAALEKIKEREKTIKPASSTV